MYLDPEIIGAIIGVFLAAIFSIFWDWNKTRTGNKKLLIGLKTELGNMLYLQDASSFAQLPSDTWDEIIKKGILYDLGEELQDSLPVVYSKIKNKNNLWNSILFYGTGDTTRFSPDGEKTTWEMMNVLAAEIDEMIYNEIVPLLDKEIGKQRKKRKTTKKFK